MKELSLFSGAGGGLLGSLLLGWEPIGYVEFNDYCQRVIAQRIADGILPNAPIFGDIRTFVSEGYAAAYTGLVDVITGGFPCQPFSVAGKQQAADDDRNMWPATIEVVRIVRPVFVFFENVPGLLSTGYAFTVIDDLQRAGYQVLPPAIVGADDVGAPHKRERLWLCAYAEGERTRRLPERQRRQDEATTDANGMGKDVSDANGRVGTEWRLPQRENAEQSQLRGDSQDVSDAARQQDRRLQQREISPHVGASCEDVAHATSRHGYDGGRGGFAPNADRNGVRSESWQVEPELGRLADGIPNRVDRLKAAGNAQVPAVVRAAWHLLTQDL